MKKEQGSIVGNDTVLGEKQQSNKGRKFTREVARQYLECFCKCVPY